MGVVPPGMLGPQLKGVRVRPRMLTGSLDSRAFAWTADSRLASLTASTGNEGYTYSPFGTRAKVGSRTFLRAGAGVTAAVLDDGNAKYTPGVSEITSNVTTFSHSGLKNMGAQTDAPTSGTPGVQATRTYDAFGATQSASGIWQGPFGYAGAYGYQTPTPQPPPPPEGEGGFMLLGHRYYDGSLGRFYSRDPVGEGSNWYAYCDNSPGAFVDPDGLAKIWIAWRPVEGTGANHALIIIKDERSGRIWVFEGGPGGAWPDLLEGDGRLIEDGEEYDRIMGYRRELIHDDDLSGMYWAGKLWEALPRPVPYDPVRPRRGSGNSNSWVREMLENVGLPQRKPGRSGWLPRWGDDPWTYLGRE